MTHDTTDSAPVTAIYAFLGVVFTSCLLMSNILASKLIEIGPLAVTAGVLVFPIAYVVNDILTEVYGFRATRRVIWLGFGLNAVMAGVVSLAVALPSPAWFDGTAFRVALSSTPRIVLGGLAAYLLGSWVNAMIMSRMKVRAGADRGFSARAIVSTIAGETVDSSVFVPIAFLGSIPLPAMLIVIGTQVAMKTLYELVILPVTGRVVRVVKSREGLDVLDQGVRYGLFPRLGSR